jgi:hypothetical protein
MNDGRVMNTIRGLVGRKCRCKKLLALLDGTRMVIKTKVLVIDEEKGIIEIKCSNCATVTEVIISA